jgi:NADPH-dependent glutamate synthase beta subunit-like oxidoreductase
MVIAMSTVEFDPPRFARRDDGRRKPVAVLGGGPAGLTAGYLLARQGRPVIVFEAEDQVGGLAKTATASISAATASSPSPRRSTTSGTR